MALPSPIQGFSPLFSILMYFFTRFTNITNTFVYKYTPTFVNNV